MLFIKIATQVDRIDTDMDTTLDPRNPLGKLASLTTQSNGHDLQDAKMARHKIDVEIIIRRSNVSNPTASVYTSTPSRGAHFCDISGSDWCPQSTTARYARRKNRWKRLNITVPFIPMLSRNYSKYCHLRCRTRKRTLTRQVLLWS